MVIALASNGFHWRCRPILARTPLAPAGRPPATGCWCQPLFFVMDAGANSDPKAAGVHPALGFANAIWRC